MSTGLPSWDSRQACSPRASERRCLEVLDSGVESCGAFVRGEQVGLQGGSGDGRAGRRAGGGRWSVPADLEDRATQADPASLDPEALRSAVVSLTSNIVAADHDTPWRSRYRSSTPSTVSASTLTYDAADTL